MDTIMKNYIQPQTDYMLCTSMSAVCTVSEPLGINIGSQIPDTDIVGD